MPGETRARCTKIDETPPNKKPNDPLDDDDEQLWRFLSLLFCTCYIHAEKKQRYAYAGLGGAGMLGRQSTPPKSAALNGKK